MKRYFDSENPTMIKQLIVGASALLADWLGILFPKLMLLVLCMAMDYGTGIAAAGYTGQLKSSKGFWGIVKKLMTIVIAAVAMICDWVILNVGEQLGIVFPTNTFFGLLVCLWLIFNELISILENLIKMEMALPKFLVLFVSKFKNTLEEQGMSFVEEEHDEAKKQ